ncbi:class I SAM-dependent methyltransferase [Rhodopseudomonas palustris]|nr:class I SAM-dependent methyltransferase [Rhodopseudomonas palustris]
MCGVTFEAGSFDAVGAFYSITHVPPTQQGPLVVNIARWLKPGGRLQRHRSGCSAGYAFG